MDVSDTRPRSGAGPSRPSGCLAPGCPCQDARIVSHRRARFFTHLAVANGHFELASVLLDAGADKIAMNTATDPLNIQ